MLKNEMEEKGDSFDKKECPLSDEELREIMTQDDYYKTRERGFYGTYEKDILIGFPVNKDRDEDFFVCFGENYLYTIMTKCRKVEGDKAEFFSKVVSVPKDAVRGAQCLKGNLGLRNREKYYVLYITGL